MKYKVVLADPPWEHYGDPFKHAAAGKHYGLMTQQEISLLPVRELMDSPAALFLWSTGPRLDLAIQTIRDWGLHYRGVLYVWVKTNQQGKIIEGQGIPPTFTKPTTEFLLSCTTNKAGRPFPIQTFRQAQVILSPRGRHSEKPAVFYELIEELCGPVSRIELFARNIREGWDAWGNESPRNDIEWPCSNVPKGT